MLEACKQTMKVWKWLKLNLEVHNQTIEQFNLLPTLFLVLFILHLINSPSLPLSDESFSQTCKIGLESCYYHQLISENFTATK